MLGKKPKPHTKNLSYINWNHTTSKIDLWTPLQKLKTTSDFPPSIERVEKLFGTSHDPQVPSSRFIR